nr:sigma-70 family RNA polymerase sigma factor [uncultured Gemmiger sp.]
MSAPIPAVAGKANTTALFDQIPREEFIQRNLGLARTCAGRFIGRGIEYEDLYAAGCLGLVKACDGFDPERGVCFSTYAVPVILGEIKKLFRDGGTVKVSRSLKELGLKINAERERCLKQTGTEPGVSQLAEILGSTPEQIAMAIRAAMPVVSLTPTESEDGNREWDIPVESPEEKLSERIGLREVLDKLPSQDRALIRLRFFGGKTQSETAKVLHTTQVQISRRERKILKWMRLELTGEEGREKEKRKNKAKTKV